MTTLLLARHGETDWNAEGRLQGHTDRPLNEHGRMQAKALAEELAAREIAAIYSSDLARARETAEIVAERLRLPIVVDADLREKNWGSWEGLTPSERERIAYVGETTHEHRERTLGAVGRIAGLHPPSSVILVVTHGGSVRRVQAAVLGMAPPVVDNCTVWAVAYEGGLFRPID